MQSLKGRGQVIQGLILIGTFNFRLQLLPIRQHSDRAEEVGKGLSVADTDYHGLQHQ